MECNRDSDSNPTGQQTRTILYNILQDGKIA
jgi:hypothetical protein